MLQKQYLGGRSHDTSPGHDVKGVGGEHQIKGMTRTLRKRRPIITAEPSKSGADTFDQKNKRTGLKHRAVRVQAVCPQEKGRKTCIYAERELRAAREGQRAAAAHAAWTVRVACISHFATSAPSPGISLSCHLEPERDGGSGGGCGEKSG
jgi:hypothetical protein